MMKRQCVLLMVAGLMTGSVPAALASPLVLMGPPVFMGQQAAAEAADAALGPAQIEAARPVIAKLFPEGTYRRMMGENMSGMIDSMLGSALALPVADIARMSGQSADTIAQMDEGTLQEAMAIIDPHFRQRTKSGMDAMMGVMADMMDGYEPRVRDALTRAYARRFSLAQLEELNSFFSTPTGSAYAAESMMIFMDKEIIAEMQALMPDMMKQMPDLVEKAEKATASIPPARKASALSKAERARLAALLGVDEKQLKDRPIGHDHGAHDDAAGVSDTAAEEGTE